MMKTLTKTLAIATVIASFAAPSFAAMEDDIRRHAGTNGNINVQVDGDTITLSGFVEDTYKRQQAERMAKSQGYEVNNYLILSN